LNTWALNTFFSTGSDCLPRLAIGYLLFAVSIYLLIINNPISTQKAPFDMTEGKQAVFSSIEMPEGKQSMFSTKISYGNFQDQILNRNNNAIQRSFLDNKDKWNAVPQDILDISARCQPPVLLDYKMIQGHLGLQEAFRSRSADHLMGECKDRSCAFMILDELSDRMNIPQQNLYLLADMKSKSGIYEKLFVRGKPLNDMVRCTFTGPDVDRFYEELRSMLREEPDLSIQVKQPKKGATWDVVKIYLYRADCKVNGLFHVPIEIQLQNLGATIWYRSSTLHKIYEEQRLAGGEGGFIEEVREIGEAAYRLNDFAFPKVNDNENKVVEGPFRVSSKGGKWSTVGDLSRVDSAKNQVWLGDHWTDIVCYPKDSDRMMSPYIINGKLVTGDGRWVWMNVGVLNRNKLRIVARLDKEVNDMEFSLSFNRDDPSDRCILNTKIIRDEIRWKIVLTGHVSSPKTFYAPLLPNVVSEDGESDCNYGNIDLGNVVVTEVSPLPHKDGLGEFKVSVNRSLTSYVVPEYDFTKPIEIGIGRTGSRFGLTLECIEMIDDDAQDSPIIQLSTSTPPNLSLLPEICSINDMTIHNDQINKVETLVNEGKPETIKYEIYGLGKQVVAGEDVSVVESIGDGSDMNTVVIICRLLRKYMSFAVHIVEVLNYIVENEKLRPDEKYKQIYIENGFVSLLVLVLVIYRNYNNSEVLSTIYSDYHELYIFENIHLRELLLSAGVMEASIYALFHGGQILNYNIWKVLMNNSYKEELHKYIYIEANSTIISKLLFDALHIDPTDIKIVSSFLSIVSLIIEDKSDRNILFGMIAADLLRELFKLQEIHKNVQIVKTIKTLTPSIERKRKEEGNPST
jgi:hypothetical protein